MKYKRPYRIAWTLEGRTEIHTTTRSDLDRVKIEYDLTLQMRRPHSPLTWLAVQVRQDDGTWTTLEGFETKF